MPVWYKIGKYKPFIGTGVFGPPVVTPRLYLTYQAGSVEEVAYEYVPGTDTWTAINSTPAVLTVLAASVTLAIGGNTVLKVEGTQLKALSVSDKSSPALPVARFVSLSRNVPDVMAVVGANGRLFSHSISTKRAFPGGTAFKFFVTGVQRAEFGYAGITATDILEVGRSITGAAFSSSIARGTM